MSSKSSSAVKTRNSSFELLRLLAIILVIFSHFNLWSFNLENATTEFSMNILIKLLFTAGCIANIIFILLSGYFLIKSRIKYKKIIALVLEMMFYSVSCLLAAKFFFHKEISFHELKISLIPFPFGNWFLVSYIILYLLSPYLNKLILTLNKQSFIRLIAVYALLFSVILTVTDWSFFSSFSVFPLAYFIGAYIRLYAKHYNKKYLIKKIIGVSMIIAGSVALIYLIVILLGKPELAKNAVYFLAKNQSPLVIIMGTLIFLLFREIELKYNPAINRLAGSVLGIYLIHENVFMRNFLWGGEFFYISIESNTFVFCFLAILKVLCVFVMCLIIDQLRMIALGKIEASFSNKIYDGAVVLYLRFLMNYGVNQGK